MTSLESQGFLVQRFCCLRDTSDKGTLLGGTLIILYMLSPHSALTSIERLQAAIVREPWVIAPDATVMDAIAFMTGGNPHPISTQPSAAQFNPIHQAARSSCVFVVENNHLIGVLNERDIVRLNAQQQLLPDLLVRQAMTHPVIMLHEFRLNDVFTALTLLQQHQIRHLPLLNEQDKLAGFLTHESLLQALNLSELRNHQQLRVQQEIRNFLLAQADDNENFLDVLKATIERKKAESALRESEARFRKMAETLQESERRYRTLTAAAPVAIFRFDTPLNCVYVSNRWSEMTGRPLESALGHGWMDALHPDDRDYLLAKYLESYAHLPVDNRPMDHDEGRHLRPDGSINWFYVQVAPEVNRDGEIVGYIGTLTDITERKLAEDQLQLLNQQLEAKVEERTASLQEQWHFIEQVVNSTTAILFIYDIVETRNIYVNSQITTILGYSPREEQVLSKNFLSDLVHPDDLPRLIERFEQHLANRDLENINVGYVEYRIRHANGEWRWMQTRDRVFKRSADGTPCQIIGTAIDISDRKAAETALRESESHLQRLASNAPGMIYQYVLRADGSDAFTYVSPGCRDIYELEPEALLRDFRQVWAMIHPEDLERVSQVNFNSAQNLERFDVEFRLLPPSGHLRWVRAISDPIRQANGNVLWDGFVLDVSDRKQAELQLQELNLQLEDKVNERTAQLQQTNEALVRATRLKDEFLANMSHELRTPLNAILGMTEGLLDEVLGNVNQEQTKALQTIERSGTHLLELITEILDVAKIESGQMELSLEHTPLHPICQASLALIHQQSLSKQIQVETKLPLHLPDLWADAKRIRQVLINLLNNAVKFTPEGGLILLEARLLPRSPSNRNLEEVKNFIRISVTDTGIGIAPEHIQKLFQPFIQIDSALNRKYAGTGLGLSLVKRIVELHGGTVELVSEVGVGSCFTIDLPCGVVHLSSPQTPEKLTSSVQKPNQNDSPLILLAEDNPANADSVMNYLRAKGYRLICAKDGQEAVKLAQSEHPALILMDVQMPDVDGLEAMQQIRRDPRLANTPMIALTALVTPNDRDRCLVAGANDFISKPIKLKDLVAKIHQFLALAASGDSSAIGK